MTALLEARDLYRFYHSATEETLALRGVSLHVDAGEIVAVTGPSGSGKSTLLACLAGLDEPDGGSVRVDGEILSHRPEASRAAVRAARIGVLFQSVNLLQHLTVAQNIRLAQQLAPGSRRAESLDAILTELDIETRRRAYPSELSGGELARAGLAVAVANDPVLLLADEPTGELDQETASHVITHLRRRARAGTATVVVTHSDEVAAAADRVIALRDGRIAS
ncbi:MAG TPA: ABC transporter ATP-binding protein [Acidimicrobiia bacterium]